MKRVRALATVVVFAASFGAATLGMGWFSGKSGDLRSSAEIHAIHLEQELDCASCHEGATASVTGTDDLRPSKSLCADCHDVEDESECSVCHRSAEPAGYPEPAGTAQLFAHKTHLDYGLACEDCHGEAANPAAADKALCRTCHATASGSSDCGVCHAGSEPLIPVSHTPDWMAFHSVEAGWDEARCATCHTQSDCQECHAGDNVRPRSHPLDFAFNHGLLARSGEAECAVCHVQTDFCSGCHVAERVLPQNHSRADWLAGRRGGRHAEEALFDLESCVACHDQGTESPLCAECHGR